MRAISYLACLCLLLSIAVKAQNRVMHFEGGEEMIHIESPISGSGDFTAEIWYRGDVGLNGRAALFGWNPSSGSGGIQRFIILQSGNRINVLDYSLNNGSSFVRPGFPISADGEWHHIAVIKSGDQITLVWDGDRIYRYTTEQSSPFDLQSLLTIARPNGATWDSWDGEMDEFRVWDYARTTDEIIDNKDCIMSPDEPGLVLYYDFQNTIQFVGQDLIPDRTFPTNSGIMFDFLEAGDDNLLTEDIGVNDACAQSLSCESNFTYEREPCSPTYDFFADTKGQGDIDAYLWEVTNPAGVTETFTTSNINYTFNLFGAFDINEVCLTVVYEDGCEDTYCENIIRPASDQSYYVLTTFPEDQTLTANAEICNASVQPQILRMRTCFVSDVVQSFSRSDGKDMTEPYEIGSTTVTLNIGTGIGEILTNVLETFTYEVIVEGAEGCCDDEMILEESLIPNPGFEDVECEPTTHTQLDCAVSWIQATDATSDLYGPSFMGGVGGLGLITPPPNNSDHWVGAIIDSSIDYVEYVGACLLEPIEPSVEYTFELYIGTPSEDRFGGTYVGDFVILGIPDCSIPLSGGDCKEDNYEVIGRTSLNIQAGTWTQNRVSIEIMANQQYEAIIFGPSCDPSPSGQGDKTSFYLVFDDLIVIEGEPCDEDTSVDDSDCFTVMNEQISCLDHDTWEVTLQLRNDNDQIFDRLLTFAQQPGTAISPSLSIDFGTGVDMVPPGDISGEMTFQIRRQDFVAEEVEVCFDVIPQNPQGGDCCKDDFCVTLPVCCVPEETTSIDFNMNTESEDCCYDLEVSNLCAEDYFTGLLGGVVGEGITLVAEGQNGWTAETVPFFGTELIAFYFGDEIDQNFVPILEEPTLIATVCLDGVTSENVDDQQFNITWANIGEDGENGEFAFGEEFITECEPAPCNLVFNPTITCDDENNYQLTFLLQMSEDETRVAQQLVINPLGNTQVSQYSPQTFDDVMLSPGEMRSFTIDLHEVDQGETFEFQVTMHNFNEPLEDGTYWCCYNGQEVNMTIPPCIQGGQGPTDPPGIQLDPAELIALARPLSYVVYPNPVQDVFNLAFEQPTEEGLVLELINMQGELMAIKDIEGGAERYSLSMREALPAIYFIRIKGPENSTLSYRKILKL